MEGEAAVCSFNYTFEDLFALEDLGTRHLYLCGEIDKRAID